MPLKKEEIERKILHFIFGTIMPVGIFYIPQLAVKAGWTFLPPWTLPAILLAAFLAGFIIIEALRRHVRPVTVFFNKHFGRMLRAEESHKTTGATYINAAGLLCSIIFRNHPHISFMALSTFIWGDAVAALVGQSIGRTKIGKKSLEGSAACFALCMLLFMTVFPHVPGLLAKWNNAMPFHIALAASASVTVFELVPLRISKRLTINDNLAVPVITGLVLLLLGPG